MYVLPGMHSINGSCLYQFVLVQIERSIFDSLESALPIMQSHLNTFQKTFAPVLPDDSRLIKAIIDTFTFIFFVGISYVWDVGK